MNTLGTTDAPSEPAPQPADGERLQAMRRTFERFLGVPFTDGNRVERLLNGERIFPAMLEAIEAARESVDLLTFVYWSGDIAARFAETLAAKARAGVQTRVLLDAVGAMKLPGQLFSTMREAGVDARYFRPVSKFPFVPLGHRTHRKILVCDGTVGFTGGVGIAEPWEGDARSPDEWRDSHFRVRGPAVRGLESAFLDNWLEVAGGFELPVERELAAEENGCPIQVIRSDGLSQRSDMLTATLLALRHARARIRVQTAYFVPDPAISQELCDAARRGVDVAVMVPGKHSDQELCRLAGRTEFAALLDAGVRILRYEHSMLHAKIVTSDDALAVVGSPNFNHRSVHRDDEVAVIAIDRDLVSTLVADFDDDARRCELIEPSEWPRRGAGPKLLERLARFLRSHL